MPHAEPLITPEELQCLLGGASARSDAPGTHVWNNLQNVHFGAALWLVKGVFLYAVLMHADAANLMGSSRYLGMRGTLEILCLTAFWGACLHPRGRSVACGTMLVASTTLLLDAMTLLALPG
jgi:hypothetical protein